MKGMQFGLSVLTALTSLVISAALGFIWGMISDSISNAGLIVALYSVVNSIVVGLAFTFLPNFRPNEQRGKWLLMLGLISLVSAGTSYLCWAYSWSYSPDIPLFVIWLLANAFALAFASLVGSRSSKTHEPLAGPRRLIGVAVSLMVVLVCSLPVFYGMHIWIASRFVQKELYLIPERYTGPILVLFDQSGGQSERFENDARVYQVSSSGIVRTQFNPQRMWYEPSFYYLDSSGKRTLIAKGTNDCSIPPSDEDRIIVCSKGRGFIVTRYQDIYTNTVAYQDLVQQELTAP